MHGSAGHRLGVRQTAYPFLVAENPSRVGFADQDRLNAPASRELLYGEAAKGKTYQAVRHIHQDSEAYKKATGMGNERILRNLAAVRSAYPHLPIHLRTPLIPFEGRESSYGGPAQVDAGILARLRSIVEEVFPEKE